VILFSEYCCRILERRIEECEAQLEKYHDQSKLCLNNKLESLRKLMNTAFMQIQGNTG